MRYRLRSACRLSNQREVSQKQASGGRNKRKIQNAKYKMQNAKLKKLVLHFEFCTLNFDICTLNFSL